MPRLPGEGSIYQRSDGRWCAAIQVAGRRHLAYAKTRQAALLKLDELRQTKRLDRLIEPSKLTLGAYLTDWLDQTTANLRPSTAGNYSDVIRCHIIPELGHIRLQVLKPLHLVRLYADRSKTLSPARVQKIHRVIHKALADAVKWHLLAVNPAASVATPTAEAPNLPSWTLAQIHQFMASVRPCTRRWDALWIVLIGSGCRLGEALGLTWDAVDWAAGSLSIHRSITQVHGTHHESRPKTLAGTRLIALPAFALEALLRHRDRLNDSSPDTRIFLSQAGKTPTRPPLLKIFHTACRVAGVPELRIHDLRGIHATLLIYGQTDIKTAQRRLGHASSRMTLDRYAKALAAGDVAAAAALDRLIRSPD